MKKTSNVQRPTSNVEVRGIANQKRSDYDRALNGLSSIRYSAFGVGRSAFSSSPRRHFLERVLDQIFGRFDFRFAVLQIADGFMRVDLFVSECDEGEDGFVHLGLLGRRGMLGAGGFPRGNHAEFVFQLENDSFRGLFSEPADSGKRGDIGIHDCAFEIAYAHSAQDSERQLWANAADVVDQEPKEIALCRGHETVENLGVFADVKMSEDMDRLAGGGEFVVAGKRDENFVANAPYVDDRLGRKGRGQVAVEKSDHPSQSLTDRIQTATCRAAVHCVGFKISVRSVGRPLTMVNPRAR